MTIGKFMTSEAGAISVDWAVLSAAVAVMSLGAVGVLTTATNAFTNMQAAELDNINAGGRTLLNTDGYEPSDAALYQAFVDGLTGLSIDELDALAGYANRLHSSGAATGLASSGAGTGCATIQGAGNQACGSNAANLDAGFTGDLFVQDFLVAIDTAYADRGVGRPTHSRINRNEVTSAFNRLGLSQNEINTLWSI